MRNHGIWPSKEPDPLKDAMAEAARYALDHLRRHKIVATAVGGAFVYSSVITTKGMSDTAIESGVATPENLLAVALAAIVAALLLGTATIALLGLATVAGKKHRGAVFALAVLLAPFTASISTYSAILGNAGQPTLVFDMRDKARAYANYVERGLADAARALNAAAAIRPLKAAICALADKEGASGVMTGVAGRGSTHAAYFGACKSANSIIDIALETDSRAKERRGTAGLQVKDLTAIADDDDLDVFERLRRFRDKANEVKATVAQSRTEDVARRVRAQMDILEASIASVGLKGGSFGRTQASAIANLKANLAAVKPIVNDLLANPGGPLLQPPADLLYMAAAVWKYRLRVLSQIAIAVAADVMPYWYFFLIFLSKQMTDDKHRSVEARRRALNAARQSKTAKSKRRGK